MNHPLAFYPMHQIHSYPKKYLVANSPDDEHCTKNFPEHSDFCGGIFTIGLYLGWKIGLNHGFT